MSNKKQEQLGMNPSTAQHKLLKDIMWDLIVKTNQDTCCKCGCKMTRETFSIEHLVPWLDSDNPIELFFDLENIAFSHLKCNIADSRKTYSECGTVNRYCKYGCRCEECKEAKRTARAKYYTPEQRRATYERTGN
jgi:hypothetical protein